MPEQKTSIKTPCIGVCSTVFGDTVCRGCKRYIHEVTDWNGYSQGQKKAIDSRLEMLLTQLVQVRLRVVDSQLLAATLNAYGVRYLPYRNPYCWAFELLRSGAETIEDVSQFGLELMPEFDSIGLPAIREAIDEEFFILSQAHYDRYFNTVELNI